MAWPIGTVVEPVRKIEVEKIPHVMEGIFREDGTSVKLEELKFIFKGSRFKVVESTPVVLLSRLPAERDAGPVRLIIELENSSDWRAVG